MAQEYRNELKMHTTPKGRIIPRISASGRRTSGSGCTGSRTPSALDAQRGVHPNPDKQAESHSLNNESALAGHPTPNCPTGGPNSNRENRNAGGADLEEVANLAGHPSPRSEDSEQTGAHRGNPDTLNSCSKLSGHPTCSARDWKDTPGMATTGTNPDGSHRNRLDMLPRVAALAGHATPSSEGSAGEISEDLERVGSKFRNRKTGRILQTNLATDTLMLCGHATPMVTTNSGIGNPERACDGKRRLEDQCLGATTASTDTSTAKTAGFRLNPGFSLWLMIGIPGIVDAWASCGVRAMQSCRRSRRSS